MQHNNPENNRLEFQLINTFFRFARMKWHHISVAGLSRAEMSLLMMMDRHIKHGHSPRISDLSRHLRVSSPTITQHINNLEAQEYVVKVQSKEDKRAVNLDLTEKGQTILKQHKTAMEGYFKELIEYLGEDRAVDMLDLLSQTIEFFSEKNKNDDDIFGDGR